MIYTKINQKTKKINNFRLIFKMKYEKPIYKRFDKFKH